MRLADLSMPLKRLPVICPSRAWSKPPVQLVVLILYGNRSHIQTAAELIEVDIEINVELVIPVDIHPLD